MYIIHINIMFLTIFHIYVNIIRLCLLCLLYNNDIVNVNTNQMYEVNNYLMFMLFGEELLTCCERKLLIGTMQTTR